jgi:hypothetical protein
MRKLVAILAQALVCASLLALPIRGYAEEARPAEAVSEVDAQFEDQLAKEVESSPNFEPSSDMRHALHELPEVGDE